MEGIQGPMGFNDTDKEGLLVEGFNEVGNMVTIYNEPYYPDHLEYYGYRKDADWLEFEVKIPPRHSEKAKMYKQIIHKAEIQCNLTPFRPKNKQELMQYADEWGYLLNECYKDLYGVVPLSPKQIKALVKDYFRFMLTTDYVIFLLDAKQKLAAFAIGIPSLSQALGKARGKLFPFGFFHLLKALHRSNPHVDFLLIGVRPDCSGQGAKMLIVVEMFKTMFANQVTQFETAPQLETNHNIVNTWNIMGARQHKRRRCYIKSLA